MKHFLTIFYVSFVILLHTNTLFADSKDSEVLLRESNFEHIEFSRIKSNLHRFHNQQLKIEVDSSASFLMKPFNAEQLLTKVSELIGAP